MDDRGYLTTEHRNPRSRRLDRLSVAEAFDLINSEDTTITRAVAAARDDICRAIELVVAAFRAGGRLIYVGAGTSGRLGVLDAAECPPTFLSDPHTVQGIIAGGLDALIRSVEGAEDRPESGDTAMDDKALGPNDLVFAIATGGTTPFVHSGCDRAGGGDGEHADEGRHGHQDGPEHGQHHRHGSSGQGVSEPHGGHEHASQCQTGRPGDTDDSNDHWGGP